MDVEWCSECCELLISRAWLFSVCRKRVVRFMLIFFYKVCSRYVCRFRNGDLWERNGSVLPWTTAIILCCHGVGETPAWNNENGKRHTAVWQSCGFKRLFFSDRKSLNLNLTDSSWDRWQNIKNMFLNLICNCCEVLILYGFVHKRTIIGKNKQAWMCTPNPVSKLNVTGARADQTKSCE